MCVGRTQRCLQREVVAVVLVSRLQRDGLGEGIVGEVVHRRQQARIRGTEALLSVETYPAHYAGSGDAPNLCAPGMRKICLFSVSHVHFRRECHTKSWILRSPSSCLALLGGN